MQNLLDNILAVFLNGISALVIFMSVLLLNNFYEPETSSRAIENLSAITLTTIITGLGSVSYVFVKNVSDTFVDQIQNAFSVLALGVWCLSFHYILEIFVISFTINLIYLEANRCNIAGRHVTGASIRLLYPLTLSCSILLPILQYGFTDILTIWSNLCAALVVLNIAFRKRFFLHNAVLAPYFTIGSERVSLVLSDVLNFISYRSIFTFVFSDSELIKGALFSSLLLCEVLYLIPNALVPKLSAKAKGLSIFGAPFLSVICLYIIISGIYYGILNYVKRLEVLESVSTGALYTEQLFFPVFLMGLLKFTAPFFYKYNRVNRFWVVSAVGSCAFILTCMIVSFLPLARLFQISFLASVLCIGAASFIVLFCASRSAETP